MTWRDVRITRSAPGRANRELGSRLNANDRLNLAPYLSSPRVYGLYTCGSGQARYQLLSIVNSPGIALAGVTQSLFEVNLFSYLIYVARVRNGFVPASRREVFAKLRPLLISGCPFVNLPETHKGRWGEGLTAADMQKCAWVRPQLVARIEFLEWIPSDHLRHAKFAGLRDDLWADYVDLQEVIKSCGAEAHSTN